MFRGLTIIFIFIFSTLAFAFLVAATKRHACELTILGVGTTAGLFSLILPKNRLKKPMLFKLFFVFPAAAFFFSLLLWATGPLDALLSFVFIPDDCFYYMQIARNIVRGYGSTFDRVDETNGYQPLWLLLLLLPSSITAETSSLLRCNLLFFGFFYFLASLAVFEFLRRLVNIETAFFVSALFLLSEQFFHILIMESAILVLLFALLLSCVLDIRRKGANTENIRRFGVLLSLLFLARVDTLPVVLTSAITAFILRTAGMDKKRLLLRWVAGLPVMTVVAYMTFNYFFFGIYLPVSCFIKANPWKVLEVRNTLNLLFFNYPALLGNYLLHYMAFFRGVDFPKTLSFWFTWILFAGFLYLIFKKQISRKIKNNSEKQRTANWLAGAVLCGTFIHYCSYAMMELPNPWYMLPEQLILLTGLAGILELRVIPASCGNMCAGPGLNMKKQHVKSSFHPARKRWKVLSQLLLPVVLICISSFEIERAFYETRFSNPSPHPARLLTDHMRNNYNPDTLFGSWNAGIIGFLSDMHVINLDGLVNSYEYYRTWRKNCRPVLGYLEKKGIMFLADIVEQLEMQPVQYFDRNGWVEVKRFGPENGCRFALWKKREP